MNAKQPLVARVTRRFEAAPERVFDAWLDPQKLQTWMGAASQTAGMGKLVQVEIDARVGGSFRFVYQRGAHQIVQTGEYLQIDRPRRLVFTWAMALPDVERVIIEIVPVGTGCELTLTHEMDPQWTGDVSPATEGWAIAVAALAEALIASSKRI